MGNFKGTQNSLGDFKVVGDFSQHIRRRGTEINLLVFGYYLIVSVKQLSGLRNRLRNCYCSLMLNVNLITEGR